MGCGRSKSVATSRPADIDEGSATNIASTTRQPSSRKVSNSRNNNNNNNNSNNNNNNSKNNNSKSVNCSNPTYDHPEIVVFGETNVDAPLETAENAKPRLSRSGIGRCRNDFKGPITPCLGPQDNDYFQSTSRTEGENTLDLSNLSLNSDVSLGDDDFTATEMSADQTEPLRLPLDDDLPGFFSPAAKEKLTNREMNGFSYVGDGKDVDHFPPVLNTSKSNLISSRSSSTAAGSILTTAALNTSMMTANGDEYFLELPTGTSLADLSDLDDSVIRTLSITPSVHFSEDPTPVAQHIKSCVPILEEYEGGFTPRSVKSNDVKLPPQRTFLAKEIVEHNKQKGWNEWSVHKGKVYDNNTLKRVFTPIILLWRERRAEIRKLREQEREERRKRKEEQFKECDGDERNDVESDDNESESDFNCNSFEERFSLIPEEHIEDIHTWNQNGVRLILRSGLDNETVNENLPQCCIGSLEKPSEKRYWDDIRGDVKVLLSDLVREDSKDQLSTYRAEYMQQLQRWLKKYRDQNPQKPRQEIGDPNHHIFALPDGISENAECLREWLEVWEVFNTEVPDHGSWNTLELEEIDLGDPHEIFAASLKSHIDLSPLVTNIDGEAGWHVIEDGLFADDVMTEAQRLIEQQRSHRSDLQDHERMRRRRTRLLKYFVEKYEMDRSEINHFLNWAQAMERGEQQFKELCEYGSVGA